MGIILEVFLLVYLFFTKCIGEEIRERKLYFWGGGLEKNVNVVEGKKERREFIKRTKRTKGELEKM